MRVLVLGGDGYLGWPTALHLSDSGHEVAVLDNFARSRYDEELGVCSLVPIEDLDVRIAAWQDVSGQRIESYAGDLLDADFVYDTLRDFGPDAIVHFAEQRAAPYSMIDRAHAVYTHHNNVIGTLNLLYGIAEIEPGHPSGQARHHGRVRHTQHRHRGGLARARAQRPQRPGALPQAARLLLPPEEGARLAQHRVRLPDLGFARDRPQPGRRVRPADSADRAGPTGSPPGSTTTASSEPC